MGGLPGCQSSFCAFLFTNLKGGPEWLSLCLHLVRATKHRFGKTDSRFMSPRLKERYSRRVGPTAPEEIPRQNRLKFPETADHQNR